MSSSGSQKNYEFYSKKLVLYKLPEEMLGIGT